MYVFEVQLFSGCRLCCPKSRYTGKRYGGRWTGSTYISGYRNNVNGYTHIVEDGQSDRAEIYIIRCRIKPETEMCRPQKNVAATNRK